MNVYGKTKLAQLLFTKYLSEKIDSEKITINAMHPGIIPTNLISKNGILGSAITLAWKCLGKSTKDGAKTIVYLAVSEDVKNISGKYFIDCQPVELAPHATDAIAARTLWTKSAEMSSMPYELGF